MITLKPAKVFRDKVHNRFRPTNGAVAGYSIGMHRLNHLRFEKSQTTLWSGFNGHGKSLILNQLMLNAVASFDEKFVVASLEMLPDRNLHRTARQVTGLILPSVSQIDHCLDWCGDAIQFYDYVGRADVKKMLEVFAKSIGDNGTTSIIIDSLMKMGLAEDAYSEQKLFVEDMSNFALKHNVHVHIVAHSRKQRDENEVSGKMDVMGAGGMTNIVDWGFSLWRNKPKEKKLNDHKLAGTQPTTYELQEHDALLNCWKCRDNGENEKIYSLWYDHPSMQYLENYYDAPKLYAEESPF